MIDDHLTGPPVIWIPWIPVLDGWGIATGDDLPRQPAAGAVAAGEHFHFVESPTWSSAVSWKFPGWKNPLVNLYIFYITRETLRF